MSRADERVQLTLTRKELQMLIDAMLGYGARHRAREARLSVNGKRNPAGMSEKVNRIFDLRAHLIDVYRDREGG